MRKISLAAAAFTVGVSGVAMADTVKVKTVANFSQPNNELTTDGMLHFRGTEDIVFEVAGKRCKLNGSARGSVPMGCNYTVTVQPSGKLSGRLRDGNQVCTQTADVASSCN